MVDLTQTMTPGERNALILLCIWYADHPTSEGSNLEYQPRIRRSLGGLIDKKLAVGFQSPTGTEVARPTLRGIAQYLLWTGSLKNPRVETNGEATQRRKVPARHRTSRRN